MLTIIIKITLMSTMIMIISAAPETYACNGFDFGIAWLDFAVERKLNTYVRNTMHYANV